MKCPGPSSCRPVADKGSRLHVHRCSCGKRFLAAGLALGIATASMLRDTINSILFGVTATNPVVLMAAAGTLALVALSACLIPARRAALLDPLVALAE